MNQIKIGVLVPNQLSKGVIESQVISFFNKIDHRFAICFYTIGPSLKIGDTIIKGYENASLLVKDLNREKFDFLYIRRTLHFMPVYLRKRSFKIIFSFRSLTFSEVYYKNKNILLTAFFFMLEGLIYLLADEVTSVTDKLANKLRKYYVINRDVHITPCYCVEKFNTALSDKQHGYKYVYIGGASKWQCIDTMFKLFLNLKKNIPNASLTIFSGEREIFIKKTEALSQEIKSSINIISCSRDELLKKMTLFDYGFLLRENNLVNNTASPIKFYEYVAAGIIPIITKGIGDISEDDRVKKFAVYYNMINDNSQDLINEFSPNLYSQKIAEMQKFNKQVSFKNSVLRFEQMIIKSHEI